MDFSFNEEQQMVQRTARDFMERECPISVVRELETSQLGYSPDMWRTLSDLGWIGLGLPEEFGGSGGDVMHLLALYEEFGRALFPSPHFASSILGGQLIAAAGTDQQKADLLPRIASGDLLATLAYAENPLLYDPRPQSTTATPDGDGYRLNGTKLFVPDAHVADVILCAARSGQDGVTLLVVDKNAPGVTLTATPTLASDKQFTITFDGVSVPRSQVLGQPDQGWDALNKVLQIAIVLQSAYMAGAMQKVLDITVDYAKTRVQFGRPIGTFQAVSHKCSEMVLMVDGSRYLTYETAWTLNSGQPAAQQVAMTKNWVSTSMEMVCYESHQIHAGVGLTWDYDLHYFTRRGRVFESAWGDADYHREQLADLVAAGAGAS